MHSSANKMQFAIFFAKSLISVEEKVEQKILIKLTTRSYGSASFTNENKCQHYKLGHFKEDTC